MINTKDIIEGRFSLEEPQNYELNPIVEKVIQKPNKETDPVPNENTAGSGGSETTGSFQTTRDNLQLRSFNGVDGTQSKDNHFGFNGENGLSMLLLPPDDTKPSPSKEGVTPPPPAKNITLGNDDKKGVAGSDICGHVVITDDGNIEVVPIIKDHDDEEDNVVSKKINKNDKEILSSYQKNTSLIFTSDDNIEVGGTCTDNENIEVCVICTENENIPEEVAQMSPSPNNKKIVEKVVKKSKKKGHPKRQTRKQKLRQHNQNLKQTTGVTTGKKCKKEKQENAETQIERSVEEDDGIITQIVGEEEELKEGEETTDKGESTNEGDTTTEEEDTINSSSEEESDDDIEKDGHPGASNSSVPKIKESKPKEVNKEDNITSASESFTVEIDKAKFTREKTCPLGMSGHYEEGHCDGELICTPGHRIMATGWKEGLAFVRRDIAIAQSEEYATFAMKPIANEKGVG